MKDINKNYGLYFKSDDIVFCIDIFLQIRRNTHVTQNLPENYLNKIQEFVSYNIKLRNKNIYELYAITNIDETLIYSNIPTSTTVQTIWSKKVNIRTQGQENWRLTAVLTILSSREN